MLQLDKVTIIQYVEDLRIASSTKKDSDNNIIKLLNSHGSNRYRVSFYKTQISTEKVKY